MYQPLNPRAANPITFSVDAARILLWGGRSNNPVFHDWQRWLNNLDLITIPENLFNRDVTVPLFPAFMREGTQGMVWVSENFADLFREVYLEAMARVVPTLPFTSFWANLDPYWNLPVQMTRRPMDRVVYVANDSPPEDVTIPQGSQVIIAFATPEIFGDEVELSYASAQHEDNTVSYARAASVSGTPALLAIGGWNEGYDRPFVMICQSDERILSFAHACVLECAGKGLNGVDIHWEWPDTAEKAEAFQRLITLSAPILHAAELELRASVGPLDTENAVNGAVLTALDKLHIKAMDMGNPTSSYEDVEELLAGIWLPKGHKDKQVLIAPCYGWDFDPSGSQVLMPYVAIVDQFGPTAVDLDQIDNVTYNGRPTIQKKARLAGDLGMAGIGFWCINMDHPTPGYSLVVAGMDAAASGTVEPSGLQLLGTANGWTFVTGESSWNNPRQVAAVIYPGDLSYPLDARLFIDQALALL